MTHGRVNAFHLSPKLQPKYFSTFMTHPFPRPVKLIGVLQKYTWKAKAISILHLVNKSKTQLVPETPCFALILDLTLRMGRVLIKKKDAITSKNPFFCFHRQKKNSLGALK